MTGPYYSARSPAVATPKCDLQVPEWLYKSVCNKRDEYLRINEYAYSRVGKHPSVPKIVEFAIGLLDWIDRNDDDPMVKTILYKFESEFQSKIGKVGRPHSIRKKMLKITMEEEQIIRNRLKAQGVEEATSQQIIAMWEEGVGSDRRKANEEARRKKDEIKMDPELVTLDDATKKVEANNPTDNYEGRVWNKQGIKYKPPK